MTGTTILAIDLGKYKCVACDYDRATAAAEFRTVTTSRAEVERLIRAARPAVVVIEACSLAGWVHDLCGETRRPVRGGQHRGRGVEVQALQAEDGPGRRPAAGPAGGAGPAPHRGSSRRSGCGSGGR